MIEYNIYLSKIIYIYQFMYKNFIKRGTYGNCDTNTKLFKTIVLSYLITILYYVKILSCDQNKLKKIIKYD